MISLRGVSLFDRSATTPDLDSLLSDQESSAGEGVVENMARPRARGDRRRELCTTVQRPASSA